MAFWCAIFATVCGMVAVGTARTPDQGNAGMVLVATGGFLAFVLALVWLFGA